MDPRLRLEILDHCVDVGDINHYFSVTRLFTALHIMVQIANMYLKEGSLEKAYVLNLRFVMCFRRFHFHQYFGTVSSADKAVNCRNIIVVVAKAEELRARLLLQYTHEYEQYYDEQKEKRTEECREKEGSSKQHTITPLVKAPEGKEKTSPGTSGLSSSSTRPGVQ